MSSGLHNADAAHLFHSINDGLTWLVNSIALFCLSKWLIKPLSFRSEVSAYLQGALFWAASRSAFGLSFKS